MAIRGRSEPPLQPLAPPAPWRVTSHSLRALEPGTLAVSDEWWGWFTEDLLQLAHPAGVTLDVGWFPDGDPTGTFRLTVVRGTDWAHPLHTSETRSLSGLLAEIDVQLTADRGEVPPTLSDEALLAAIQAAEDNAVSLLIDLRDRGATDALIVLLSDPRPRVRYAAVDALAVTGPASAGDALLARFLLPEPDLATRRRILDALGAVGHTPAVPVLARWLSNPDADQRIAAARALARMEAVDALDAVQEAYATERSHQVRPHLQEALRRIAQARGRQGR